MKLIRFRQNNFRNLVSPEWVPPAGLVTVVGGNAQGKTNLLHAINLATGGDIRGTTLERIAFGENLATVWVEVETQFGNSRLETKLSPAGKEYRLNEGPASLRELSDLPGCVLIEPEDIDLVLGSPEGRRTFLDSLLSRFSARYRMVLSQYAKALQQRNALLKTGLSGRKKKKVEGEEALSLRAMLSVWDGELIKYGTEILSMRKRILARLSPLAASSYNELSTGLLELTAEETAPTERFAEMLQEATQDDLQRGVTSVGPHRDDVLITLDQKPAGRFASRGECRSIGLALRLAEHQLLWKHHDEAPLLLVDEWHTELDSKRKGALLAYANSLPQAILAGLETPGTGSVLQIEAGVWR